MSDPGPGDATGGRLVRASTVVAAGTLASRITGLVRTVVLAWALGLGLLGDAYNLANTTPNLLYDLLLGGILSATLVPVLVRNLEHDDEAGTHAILTVATVVLGVITVIGVLAAPAIIAAYEAVWGGGDPAGLSPAELTQRTELATQLLRLFAPQVLFYGLTTLATALLNTHRRFAAAAFAPALNNVVVIAVLVAAVRVAGGEVTADEVSADPALLWLLGLGTTAGIAAMALVLWPAVRRAGIRLRWRFAPRSESVKLVLRLSGWTLGYVLVNQVTIFVVIGLALGAESGAVTAWSYGYQFFQLPYGLFTVSIMTAFLPELSSLADRGDLVGFARHFLAGFRLVALVVLPSAVAFFVLARPVTEVLFEFGRSGDAELTGRTVAGLALGMVGFSGYLYALRGFYAFRDTRTPFYVNLLENVVQIGLSYALVAAGHGVAGLAWAFSIAYTLAAVLAAVLLRRRTGPLGARAAVRPVLTMAGAAAVMAAVMLAATVALADTATLVLVVGVGLAGIAVYLGALAVLRVPDLREISGVITRRMP